MAIVTLFFALLGFLSPARRRGILQNSHLGLRIHEYRGWICCSQGIKVLEFREQELKENSPSFLAALLFPGTTFIVFFMLNLLIWE